MHLLSVIIPTYNSEKTIERCLSSLLSQTFQDFEICIIDGSSIDETISKANQFRSHFKNIRIISESDAGTYDAMNKGIDFAQGYWLYFLGSDDELFDENVFLDVFNTNLPRNCGMMYGNVYVNGDTAWAKSGSAYDGSFSIEKILQKNICHQAIFYQKNLFVKFGKYKIQYPVCADWEANLRLFPKTKSIFIDRFIATFYGGGLSTGEIVDPIGLDLERLRRQALREYKLRRFNPLLAF